MRHLLTKFVAHRRLSDKSAEGFTIIELIIVILVTGVLIGLLFGPLDDLYTANNQGLKSTIVTSDVSSAMQTIRQTASISISYDATNSIPDPDGTLWPGSSSSSDVLITSNYATSTDSSGNKTIVTAGSPCSIQSNNYIFFVKDRILYRRTLTSKGILTACGSASWDQKQTCAARATYPRCEATDSKLLSNVDSFAITYYASAASSTTTTPAGAKAIQVTIKINTPGSSKPVTSKMRIKRTNGS